jgi:hypothetical protein
LRGGYADLLSCKAKEMLINSDHAATCWYNTKDALENGSLTVEQLEEMYKNE